MNLTPIEISTNISNRGYTIIPDQQENGMYKVLLWLNNEFIGLGKIEYKCCKKAIENTNANIYEKIKT